MLEAARVDDPELGAHHHLPDWGRILWRRQWEQAAQVDQLSSLIRSMKESLVATQADLDAITAELGSALSNINAEIAQLQAANPQLDLTGLQAAADALAAVAPPAAPTA